MISEDAGRRNYDLLDRLRTQREAAPKFKRARRLAAIDARTAEGREALAWRDAAPKVKGGAACQQVVKVEIRLATFDLWRFMCLHAWLIADANHRGTIVNRGRWELARIHEQYAEIDARFLRAARCSI